MYEGLIIIVEGQNNLSPRVICLGHHHHSLLLVVEYVGASEESELYDYPSLVELN
jgi:hypothetical protein